MRSNPLFSNPLIKPFMGVAKSLARKVLKRSKGMSMSFLMCMDKDIKDIKPFALGIITEDGHPCVVRQTGILLFAIIIRIS